MKYLLLMNVLLRYIYTQISSGTGKMLYMYMLFILHAHYICKRDWTQFSIPYYSTSNTFTQHYQVHVNDE